MHAFLIAPHRRRIINLSFPEVPGITTQDVKHMLRYSSYVEVPAFDNGDIWCLPEGYAYRHWLAPFQIRWGVAAPTLRGRAMLVGHFDKGTYSSPQATEQFLVKTIFYPVV